MESRKLVYYRGHFFDPTTHRRVQPRDGANFLLIGDQARDLPDAEPAGTPPEEPRNSEQLKHLARKRGRRYKTTELLPAGAKLRFSYANPHYPSNDPHTFYLTLREPLHLYAPLTANTLAMPKDYGELFDCQCVVLPPDHDSRFQYCEPVFARSLNEGLKNTYVHYFGNAGSPGRSAFNVLRVVSLPTLPTPSFRDIDLQTLREQVAPLLWQQES